MVLLMEAFAALELVKAFRKRGEIGPPRHIRAVAPGGRGQRISRRVVFQYQEGALLEKSHAQSAERGGGLSQYLIYRRLTGVAACAGCVQNGAAG